MAKKVSASTPRGTRAKSGKGAPPGGRVQPWAKDRLPTKADLRESPEAQEGVIPPPLPEFLLRFFGTRNSRLRPKKTEITIRLDRDISAWLSKRYAGKRYDKTINAMLSRAMKTELESASRSIVKNERASVSSQLAKRFNKTDWASLPASPPLTAKEKRALAEARKRPINLSEIRDGSKALADGSLRPISRAEWHKRAKASPLS